MKYNEPTHAKRGFGGRHQSPTVTLPRISIQSEQAMTELYNFKSAGHPGAYVCTKFDEHLNVQSTYLLDHGECACPRGQQGHSQCRHRKMIGIFKQAKHIDDGWLFDWHTRQWAPPTVNMDCPEEIHSAIVEAIGEPLLPEAPTVDEEPSAGLPEVQPPAPSAPQAAQSRPTVGAPLASAASLGTPKLLRRAVR